MNIISKKISFVGMGIVLGSILLGSASFAGTQVVNGDFEAGNTDVLTDYTFSPGNIWPETSYDVLADPFTAHNLATSFGDHTTGTGLMMAVNGATSPDLAVWSQTVDVSPDTDYVFSAWVASWTPSATAQLQFFVNDVPVGTPFTASSTPGIWEQASATWSSGTATSATLKIVDLTTDAGGNDFALDDISFESAPPTCQTCDGEPIDVTGIILTRNGANNDQAQFKLKHVTGIKAAAEAAVTQGKPVKFKIGTCGAPPIGEVTVPNVPNTNLNLTYLNLRYTVGNLDMLRCVFNTEECVLNIKGIDFDTTVLPGLLGSDIIVTLEVGDTVYVDSIPGGWKEFNSGAPGNWTKYIKD